MDNLPKVVSSLSKLPKYGARTIDIRPQDLDFTLFELKEHDDIPDIYKKICLGIASLFEAKGLVEIEAYVYNVNLKGKVIHYQINVMGRESETGQRYSTYLM